MHVYRSHCLSDVKLEGQIRVKMYNKYWEIGRKSSNREGNKVTGMGRKEGKKKKRIEEKMETKPL